MTQLALLILAIVGGIIGLASFGILMASFLSESFHDRLYGYETTHDEEEV